MAWRFPRAEAVQAHPELADLYKLEAAVKGFADEHIPDSEGQKIFLEAIRQESFNGLARDNQRSAKPRGNLKRP